MQVIILVSHMKIEPFQKDKLICLKKIVLLSTHYCKYVVSMYFKIDIALFLVIGTLFFHLSDAIFLFWFFI